MTYVLDTNVVSELMREHPNDGVVEQFRHKSQGCVLAAPTLYELEHGIAILPEGARKRALAKGFSAITKGMRILPFGRAAAHWLALANARLRVEGRLTGILDGQIAAIAITRGSTIVTRNVSEFGRYEGLSIESWHV